jgi:tRNA(Arg) A34 adenosine deaminase TadA
LISAVRIKADSGEPCPLCLTACYRAHVSRLVFGATSYDVATNGFDYPEPVTPKY